jgi:eukaryotic-like serine/threonine-protein kinase
MHLFPGQRIGQKLVLLRQIGEGGMASVWVAEDKSLGHDVAVKVLADDLTDNVEAIERFTLEARTIAQIESPYIPKVYGDGTLEDGSPFMVMELLEGVDLDTYLRTHRRLPLFATVRLVSQIAAALAEAHRMDIVHRDVKPENIFVTGSGDALVARLFDFGIAKIPQDKAISRLTQIGTMLGTPSYMSAEQLLSAKDVDPGADLWSLGVVTYLMLTGKLPFDGETFGAIVVSINRGIFDLPSSLYPEIPAEVDAWILKALDRDPSARFQTASELSESLEYAAAQAPAHPLTVDDEPVRGPQLSLMGTSRTRRGTARPRRGFVLALAMCAGAVAYMGSGLQMPSWVPKGVTRDARATWGSVAAFALGAERTLAGAPLGVDPEATVSVKPIETPPAPVVTLPPVAETDPLAAHARQPAVAAAVPVRAKPRSVLHPAAVGSVEAPAPAILEETKVEAGAPVVSPVEASPTDMITTF